MATRRKTYKLRGGDVYDVEEYPDGRYGAKGKARQKKKKPTPEQMAAVNQANRAKICRRLLIEYFDAGDYFVTYTYKVEQRPKDMTVALKDLQKALRKLRPKYKKANTPFYWIRNIERGTKGAWHIHLVIKKHQGRQNGSKMHGNTEQSILRRSKKAGFTMRILQNWQTI